VALVLDEVVVVRAAQQRLGSVQNKALQLTAPGV